MPSAAAGVAWRLPLLRDLGEIGGSETVTLLVSEMPLHTHTLMAQVDPATVQIPTSLSCLTRSSGGNAYSTNLGGLVTMAPQRLSPAGGSLPHNNMQPYLTLNFCIALQGVFPQRP